MEWHKKKDENQLDSSNNIIIFNVHVPEESEIESC